VDGAAEEHQDGTSRRRPGPVGRPPAHEVAARRQHLIQVATGLFLSRGYEATSVEMIAQSAGASKATIYRQFGDKAGLFHAILDRIVESIWPQLGTVAVEGKSVREVLTAFGHLLLSPSILDHETVLLLRLIYREAPRFPELAQIFGEAERTVIARVAEYLVLAALQGALRPADPIQTATQFIELVWGTLTRRLVIGTVAIPDEAERGGIVEAAVTLFLHGRLTPKERSREEMDGQRIENIPRQTSVP
jgi:AcrR family transcriptional regulator